MKKVTELTTAAFKAGDFVKYQNSETTYHNSYYTYLLWGNPIAKIVNGTLRISLAGHPTRTTRDRLNGIFQTFNLGAKVYQENGKQYLQDAKGTRKIDPSVWHEIYPIYTHYVRMKDSFMSGWGRCEGADNVLIFPCTSLEQAEIVAENAENRGDQKYVKIFEIRGDEWFIGENRECEKTFRNSLVQVKNIFTYGSWYKPGYFSKK